MDVDKSESETKLLHDGLQQIVIVRQEGKGMKIDNNVPVLSVVDILLSIFVVTPLVVAAWRGSWILMETYSEYFPFVNTFLAGMTIHVILALYQDGLHRVIVRSDKHWTLKIVSQFIRRAYTYVFLIATILHWRGGWTIIDYSMNVRLTAHGVATSEGIHWFLIMWLACLGILVMIRCLRNAIAPPFAICIDKGDYVFRFPTMFRKMTKGNFYLTALDCLFSVSVTGSLVITLWRGFWIICDILLVPKDFVWSSWSSLVLGLLVIGLVFRLQVCMKNLCSKSTGLVKIIAADCYIVLSCIATVLYWRGVWNLLNIYFIPNDITTSCVLSHLFGVVTLILLGCSNSMLVRGVYKDGQEPNGECVVFPCQYLRIVLEQKNDEQSEPDVALSKTQTSVDKQ